MEHIDRLEAYFLRTCTMRDILYMNDAECGKQRIETMLTLMVICRVRLYFDIQPIGQRPIAIPMGL